MVIGDIRPPLCFRFVAVDILMNKFIIEGLHSPYTLAPRVTDDAFLFDCARRCTCFLSIT
jgi:hypothetical protein